MDSRRARRTELTSTNRVPAQVTEQRLYRLIRQPKPIADRQFEIEFLGSGVEVFALTFGQSVPKWLSLGTTLREDSP